MLIHPLADADPHLVQDYMATKITFLLAKRSGLDEWEHEIETQENAVGHDWGRRNAFLFDFTLARFLSALKSAIADSASTKPAVTDPDDRVCNARRTDRFISEFCDVVSHHPLAAEAVWSSYNRETGDPRPGERLHSTTTLVERIVQVAPSSELITAVQHLPTEFRPEAD